MTNHHVDDWSGTAIGVSFRAGGVLCPGGVRDLLAYARLSESLGFSDFDAADHVLLSESPKNYPGGVFRWAPESFWPDPLVVLAAIGAVTERIQLTTSVLVAPLRPAVVVAKMSATIDNLTDGRLRLGVGSGWNRAEFDAVGVPYLGRTKRLEDSIGAWRALWEGGPASFLGSEEVACSPAGRFAFVAAPKMNLIVDGAIGKIDRAPRQEGEPAPRLLKIDTITDEIVGELGFDYTLAALSVSSQGVVAVTDWRFPTADDEPGTSARGYVHFVDAESFTLLGSTVAGDLPFTVRFSDDGDRAFVANVRTGSFTVVDVGSRTEIATLDNNMGAALGGTHGMCFVPAG